MGIKNEKHTELVWHCVQLSSRINKTDSFFNWDHV